MYRSLGLILDHEAGYYGYGISLGAVELSLENIVSGYRSLTHIEEPDTFLLFDMLRENSNRSRTFGISSILNTSIPLAVKTGTSTDFRDNWTLGYDQDIIVGVWVGNTNRESMDDVS
jgi:penicillin-binding protein 1C